VVIDEAGIADTSPSTPPSATSLSRAAVSRLIGDDQQLSMIGVGGVLRDIEAT
jgi:AAA domain